MTAVLVVANPDKPEAVRLAERAEGELRRLGLDVRVFTRQDGDTMLGPAGLALVFGGDGTVLGTVARLGPKPPPILAFNAGRLGYLADNPPDRLEEIIALALAGKLQPSRRMMVDARMTAGGEEWRATALNEFALVTHRYGRLLPISVWVDNTALMEIRADGVIVATPTGSTAYALAAGGPVVNPELSALVLAPICPHQLANRSLILGPNETVRIAHMGEGKVELLADGKLCRTVEMGETVEIGVSESSVVLLSPARGRYTVLRDKLGWDWKAGEKNPGSSRFTIDGEGRRHG